MPTPIERLGETLARSLSGLAPQGFALPDDGVVAMRRVVERIRADVGERPIAPSHDRICDAVGRLRDFGAASLNGAEFYFVCWGLTEQCPNERELIEDETFFPPFLSVVKRRRPSTLLWRGLLDAYFRYVPKTGEPGESHWRELQAWLLSDLPELRVRTAPTLLPYLTWVAALQEHQQLLSDDPCRPYAAEALRGDRTRIDQIKTAIGIPETSWFWMRLILSMVEEAIALDDQGFKDCLEALIAHLREHPTVRDEGLAKLLTRYAACADRTAHEGLKEFALDTWGSPQLSRHGKWGMVEPQVKAMVSQWLVLEDLRDFFELLQSDRRADTRRLNFWLRFIDQISFSHIAMGSQLWWSRDRDWVEFKTKKKGRISRLEGGGGSKNAFIMQIDRYYFVEFGEAGDACYGYVEDNKPFALGAGLLNYPYELKDKSKQIFWGPHMADWEPKFLARFANLGVYPGASKASRHGLVIDRSRYGGATTHVHVGAKPDIVHPVGTPDALVMAMKFLASTYKVRFEDRRPSGGALWAIHSHETGLVAGILKAHGFKYAAGKNGWWKG
jgi:hypothetical protein